MSRRRFSGAGRVEEAGAAVADRIADPTQTLIDRFRQDFAALAEKVDRDFEALRSAATVRSAVPHATPAEVTAPAVGGAELRAMLQAAVKEELDSDLGRALIGEIVRAQFRDAAEQLRAQKCAASPMGKFRSAASQKRI